MTLPRVCRTGEPGGLHLAPGAVAVGLAAHLVMASPGAGNLEALRLAAGAVAGDRERRDRRRRQPAIPEAYTWPAVAVGIETSSSSNSTRSRPRPQPCARYGASTHQNMAGAVRIGIVAAVPV